MTPDWPVEQVLPGGARAEIAAMLWDASSVRGYSIVASGDQTGTVKDFIFDEAGWTISRLTIDIGTWLSSRLVYVPVSAFAHPDAQTQKIPLTLTSAELDACPVGELDALGGQFHSLAALSKAAVEGSDEPVGQVEDFLIDSDDWQVKYCVVNPSGALSEEKVLVPVRSIVAVDHAAAVLTLDVTRQFVKDSPHYDPKQTVDGAYNESFLTYYGIRFVKT